MTYLKALRTVKEKVEKDTTNAYQKWVLEYLNTEIRKEEIRVGRFE